ncbi:unnamed protein product [Rotaria sp. Silwood1]|nr:unnamed protein product [Rotaria sp. Silwood1]CAF1629480.1 unnamed protein product [Rotaria sp. Silwood1]
MCRIWWSWKGNDPSPEVVAFMNKNYPPDWTYADFAAQFHAELYSDLANAIRNRTNLVFDLYHSMFEWFHPLFLEDKQNGFKTRLFPDV